MLKQALINEFKLSLPRFLLYTIIWLLMFFLLGFDANFFDYARNNTLRNIIADETIEIIIQYPIDMFFSQFVSKQLALLLLIQIFLISIFFGSEIPLDSEKGFLSLIKTTGTNMKSFISLKIIATSLVIIIAELIGWITLMLLEGLFVFYDYPDLMIRFFIICSFNFVTFFIFQALMIFIFVSIVYYFSYFCYDYKVASIILPIVAFIEIVFFSIISDKFPIKMAPEEELSFQGIYGILESVMVWENNFYTIDLSIIALILAFLVIHLIVFTAIFFKFAKRRQFYQ